MHILLHARKMRERLRAHATRKKEEGGFTLLELIVTVAVIGILVAVAIPSYGGIQTRAKQAALDETADNAYSAAVAVFYGGSGSGTGGDGAATARGLAKLASPESLIAAATALSTDDIAVTAAGLTPDTLCVTATWKTQTTLQGKSGPGCNLPGAPGDGSGTPGDGSTPGGGTEGPGEEVPVEPEVPAEPEVPVIDTSNVVSFTIDTRLANCTDPGVPYIGGSSNAMIDWGDGTAATKAGITDAAQRHAYTTPGEYKIKITGKVPTMGVASGVASNASRMSCFVSIDSWGEGVGTTNANYLMKRTVNLQKVAPLPATVTNVTGFFADSRFDGDISRWDVSNVTNMKAMFMNNVVFSGDLSRWNTGKVNVMDTMFYGTKNFQSNLSKWDMKSVTTINAMFSQSSFNGDVSGWDTGTIQNMQSAFSQASAFNGDISRWNVSNVTNMRYMFELARSFNQNISGWDTAKVTDMSFMFTTAAAFNQNVSGWNVSSVSSYQMFRDYSALSTPNTPAKFR